VDLNFTYVEHLAGVIVDVVGSSPLFGARILQCILLIACTRLVTYTV
jgi:hypothetical protein